MKILKFFIILFGLITLASTNINAQKFLATTIDMEMELFNFPPPTPPEDIPTAYYRPMGGEFAVDMWANGGTVELALSIYDSDGTLLDQIPSGSPTTYHRFIPIFNADTGDELYLECGFISPNGAYHADSGCTVIVDPYGVSMDDGN